jgi:hypothetical protein
MFPFSFISGGAANTERTEAFLTATGITDATIISALNAMDTSLISAGLLPSGTGAGKIKALYPIVGGTASTHKFNFIDPRDLDAAFRLQFNGGWTHSANGMQPNGGNGYADTFFNTNSNLSLTSAHLGIYVRNNSNFVSGYDLANSSNSGMTTDPTYLIARYPSDLAYLGIADTSYFTNALSLDSRGFWLGATNGSRAQILYRNGSSFATGTGSGSFANNNLYLGAANGNGTAGFYSDKEFALATLGEGLSDTNASDYYNLVQTFQTTLGRNV